MGQKTNPIIVRLQFTNKFFDSCWYSDFFFTDLVLQDILIKKYINTVFEQITIPAGRYFFQHLPKTSKIHLFLCKASKSRLSRFNSFHLAKKNLKKKTFNKKLFNLLMENKVSDKIVNYLITKMKFNNESLIKKNFYFKLFLLYHSHLINNLTKTHKNIILNKINSFMLLNDFKRICLALSFFNFIDFKRKLNLSGQKNIIKFSGVNRQKLNKNIEIINKNLNFGFSSKNVIKTLFKKFFVPKNLSSYKLLQNPFFFLKNIKPRNKLKKSLVQPSIPVFVSTGVFYDHLNSMITNKLENNTKITVYKISNDYQSAIFFAEEIIYFLERRVSFRQIKNFILKEIKKKTIIKGVRVLCSGRVGGKSKKAQRSKIDSIKYGQTSLHIFSSNIDFASRKAYTPFGTIGVKVWLNYF